MMKVVNNRGKLIAGILKISIVDISFYLLIVTFGERLAVSGAELWVVS